MFVKEIQGFIDAVESYKQSPISLEDAFMSVDIALQALNDSI